MLYSWSMLHVWLFCEQRASLWESPPKARVLHGWGPCGICSYCCVWRDCIYRLHPQGLSLYLALQISPELMAVTLQG